MIEQGDTEQVRALLQPDRQLTIFLAGCGIIGRVIVRTNPGGGIHEDQRFEHFAWMHDGQRQGADGDDIDPDDAVLRIQSADEELFAVQSGKERPQTAAAATESYIGEEGGSARLSRTSVTRNRGTAYAFLGFGCRIMFRLPCEP